MIDMRLNPLPEPGFAEDPDAPDYMLRLAWDLKRMARCLFSAKRSATRSWLKSSLSSLANVIHQCKPALKLSQTRTISMLGVMWWKCCNWSGIVHWWGGKPCLHQNHVSHQFFVWSFHQFIELQINYSNHMLPILAWHFDF
jgi:hypothetical protein